MTNYRSPWIKAGLVTAAMALPGCASWGSFSWTSHRSLAIPDTYPLGSVNRAHYHQMETNAEAADFILHRNDFVGYTAELSPAGKDRIMEISSRMRSVPFPILIERSENNSNPELDEHRRIVVAQILYDHGNADADQRTIVSQPYSNGANSLEGEMDYYRNLFSRGGIGGQGQYGAGGGGGGAGGGIGFGF